MIEFYAEVKWVHVAAAVVSGSLFLLRGMLIQIAQQRLAMAAAVTTSLFDRHRIADCGADAGNDAAGRNVCQRLAHRKLVLLAIYVVLGSFALKRAQTRSGRLTCYLLALLVFGCVLSIARSHHPLGAFARFF